MHVSVGFSPAPTRVIGCGCPAGDRPADGNKSIGVDAGVSRVTDNSFWWIVIMQAGIDRRIACAAMSGLRNRAQPDES
jgi:hypothetical protein